MYELYLNGTKVKQVWVVGQHYNGLITDNFRIINRYSGNNTCTLSRVGGPTYVSLEYSFNNADWTTWVATDGVYTMDIPNNGTLYLRGNNPNGIGSMSSDYRHIDCSQKFDIAGNIQSLISKRESYSLPDYAFARLFFNAENLDDASGLRLPATNLGYGCYAEMFYSSGISSAPAVLPAVSLTNYEYAGMFYGCRNLTAAPEIMATTLGASSLHLMFGGDSYRRNGVSYIKVHFTSWFENQLATKYWTESTFSSGTFVKPSSLATIYNTEGNMNDDINSITDYIPYNWTVQNF